jgi:hypothetical protein
MVSYTRRKRRGGGRQANPKKTSPTDTLADMFGKSVSLYGSKSKTASKTGSASRGIRRGTFNRRKHRVSNVTGRERKIPFTIVENNAENAAKLNKAKKRALGRQQVRELVELFNPRI